MKTPDACKKCHVAATRPERGFLAVGRPWSVFAFYTMEGNNTFPLPV